MFVVKDLNIHVDKDLSANAQFAVFFDNIMGDKLLLRVGVGLEKG